MFMSLLFIPLSSSLLQVLTELRALQPHSDTFPKPWLVCSAVIHRLKRSYRWDYLVLNKNTRISDAELAMRPFSLYFARSLSYWADHISTNRSVNAFRGLPCGFVSLATNSHTDDPTTTMRAGVDATLFGWADHCRYLTRIGSGTIIDLWLIIDIQLAVL